MQNILFLAFLILFVSAKNLKTKNYECWVVLHDYDDVPDNLNLRGECVPNDFNPQFPCEFIIPVTHLSHDLKNDIHLITTEGDCYCQVSLTGDGLSERIEVRPDKPLNLREARFCWCAETGGCAGDCSDKIIDYVEAVAGKCFHDS